MQWNVSGSKLCEVPTPPPESERRMQVSIIAFVGERSYLLVNVVLSKYLGCIALAVKFFSSYIWIIGKLDHFLRHKRVDPL